MRLLAAAFAVLLLAAQAPEPTPYPPGQFCAHVEHGHTPQHPCACQRECQDNIELDEHGNPHATITVHEDPQCKQYCAKDHCHCPVKHCD